MLNKTEFIWMDGKLVPWDQAQVHVLTHALHYGTGVFEGIRAYQCTDGRSAVFRLTEHIKRLFASAKIMEITIPFTVQQYIDACIQTMEANKLKEGYLRPISFVGYGAMGVYPGDNPINNAIAVWPWGAYLGPEALERGIRVKTSSFARMHVNTLMTKAKATGNYVNSVLAKLEVKQNGYDEALMLDTQGFVSEASGENIFMVRKGVIKTTPLTSVLDGITRETIITLARENGFTVLEHQFTRDELYDADEAFFSGTAAELTPIREVDNRMIGEGKAGPVVKKLQDAFFAVVKGASKEHQDWLTYYNV